MAAELKCPKCGAKVFATDEECMSCGAQLGARNPIGDVVRELEVGKGSRALRRGISRKRSGWMRAFDNSFFEGFAYLIWIASGVVLGALETVAEGYLPSWLSAPLIVVSGVLFGAMTIVMSRLLAYSRDTMPPLLRVIVEGRWFGWADAAPWSFRLVGSGIIGFAIGNAVTAASGSFAAGLAVGAVVAFGVWIWTWFAFPGMEEDA